jgi:hypothetical protein
VFSGDAVGPLKRTAKLPAARLIFLSHEAANSNGAFRRHVLGCRDLGYAAFMQLLLWAEDRAFGQQPDDETA